MLVRSKAFDSTRAGPGAAVAEQRGRRVRTTRVRLCTVVAGQPMEAGRDSGPESAVRWRTEAVEEWPECGAEGAAVARMESCGGRAVSAAPGNGWLYQGTADQGA